MIRLSVAVAGWVVILTGCDSGPKLVDVSGNIKVAGQPIDKIHIEFWPEGNGPRSIGLSDAQGNFTLQSDDGLTKGALAGKHKVVLRDVGIMKDQFLGRAGEDLDLNEGRKPRISAIYGDAAKTTLTAEVSAGKAIELNVEPYQGQ